VARRRLASPRRHSTRRLSPDRAVIVLELGGRVTRGLHQLVDTIRPAVADRGISLVAVAESRFHAALRHRQECHIPAAGFADQIIIEKTIDLPGRHRDRLLKLATSRIAIAHDLLEAARAWPPEAVIDALDAGHGYRSTLDRLTANLLELCTPAQQEALEVCLNTGYWHPQFATHPVSASELRPWVVPLEQQWGWLRPIWVRSLKRHLDSRVEHERRPLHRPITNGHSRRCPQ
jgi:hypothetical protein